MFTDAELAYLQAEHGKRLLGRVATVGPDGMPHVTPVGMFRVMPDQGFIEITGHNFERTKKFRDVARTGRAALVVDDVDPDADGWAARGIEIRGRAETVTDPRPGIRLYPERIVGWGLDTTDGPNARTVGQPA
jgi:pyridoxamine 5'-phosphate oxidase family protein